MFAAAIVLGSCGVAVAQGIFPAAFLAQKQTIATGGAGSNNFITSYTPAAMRTDSTYTVGYEFTVGASNITVIALGRFNNASTNIGSHPMAIWTASSGLLCSNTVNNTGKAVGIVYVSVTPTVLTNGQSYYIGANEFSSDYWASDVGATFTTNGCATVIASTYLIAGSPFWGTPTSVANSGLIYSGVSFQYQ